MVYALQKYRHYLLGGHFKMYTDHSTLKYLVNKPVLGGNMQMVVTIWIIWLRGHCKVGMPKCRTRSPITNWDQRGANKFEGRTPWCTSLCSACHGQPLWRYNPFLNHKEYGAGIFSPTEEGIGGKRDRFFCHRREPLQNGERWDIAKICAWIWMQIDPHWSRWGGYRRMLYRMGDNREDSSCMAMVANLTSRFKSILLGLWCMSMEWETITKG